MLLIPVIVPDADPISIDDLKERLGIRDGESDPLTEALMLAVTAKLDGPNGLLGRALLTQTWDMVLDAWPEMGMMLPLPPLQAVVSIDYIDTAGVPQTLDPASYRVMVGSKTAPGRLMPSFGGRWPSVRRDAGVITIRFRAGYGDPDQIPEPIITAMVLQIAHLRSLHERNLFLMRERVDGVSQQDFAVTEVAGLVLHAAADSMLAPFKVYL